MLRPTGNPVELISLLSAYILRHKPMPCQLSHPLLDGLRHPVLPLNGSKCAYQVVAQRHVSLAPGWLGRGLRRFKVPSGGCCFKFAHGFSR